MVPVLLDNKIGRYEGQWPNLGTDSVTFDIQADESWTIRIEPIGLNGLPPFSGNGDAVSAKRVQERSDGLAWGPTGQRSAASPDP